MSISLNFAFYMANFQISLMQYDEFYGVLIDLSIDRILNKFMITLESRNRS